MLVSDDTADREEETIVAVVDRASEEDNDVLDLGDCVAMFVVPIELVYGNRAKYEAGAVFELAESARDDGKDVLGMGVLVLEKLDLIVDVVELVNRTREDDEDAPEMVVPVFEMLVVVVVVFLSSLAFSSSFILPL